MHYDDWDSLEAHNMAGYHESLAEDGIRLEDDEDSDTAVDYPCWGCNIKEATTSFMDKPFCVPCYKATAEGNHVRDTCSFADPGGNSALRAAGPGNPRIHPCGDCGASNVLTPQDKARGYCCDSCADRKERGW